MTYLLAWIKNGDVTEVEFLADELEVELSLRTQTDLTDDEITKLIFEGEIMEEPWESQDGTISGLRLAKVEGYDGKSDRGEKR